MKTYLEEVCACKFMLAFPYSLFIYVIVLEYFPGQYIGNMNDYNTGTTSTVVNSISCPSDANVISECDFNTTSHGCADEQYEEVVTCIKCKLC